MKLLILILIVALNSAAFGQAAPGQPVMRTLGNGAIATPTGQPTPPTLTLPPIPPQHPALNQPMNSLPLPMPLQQDDSDDPMKILNPILQALTGQGGGNPYSANPYERMAGSADFGGTSSYGAGNPNATAAGLDAYSSRGQKAAIVEPFKRNFDRCTEQNGMGICKFVFQGIWGDMAHQVRPSCHNAGEAIDVGLPFQCANGGKIEANDMRALNVARCMANTTGGQLGVIFQDRNEPPNIFPGRPRRAHDHHMHIQLRFCNMVTAR